MVSARLGTSSSSAPRVFLKLKLGCEDVRGAVTLRVPSLPKEEIMDSGLTPEGRENRCSNCLDTKLPPDSVWVSCLAKITRTSPSVFTLNSSGCKKSSKLLNKSIKKDEKKKNQIMHKILFLRNV